jgi:homoserine O-acetyltransferase/O-succinyltransferase
MSRRRLLTHATGDFELESGAVLRGLVQGYHLDGQINDRADNLVVVFHALTGSADAVGDWWRPLAGPDRALDTERYAVLCVNLLGSCYGTAWSGTVPSRPPRITTRDMARAVHCVVRSLGARSVALAVGGSLGGMVALEWAATFPGLTRHTLSIASPAAHTAPAIAWNAIQRAALKLGGPARGLALARQVAMMTYRTGPELESRFGRRGSEAGFEVERYLRHQGEKLVKRFDPAAYLLLLDAMDAHDVGRGRGGVAAALSAVRGGLTGVGIPGDLLYPEEDVLAWVRRAGAEYRQIHSVHGHDAFLLEPDQVGGIVREALASRPALPESLAAAPGAATAGQR